jgi:UDP-N-acetylglucosamine 2-epimerase (non-hydrolysing)
MKKKIVSVLGTRPEIIKFSPLFPLLDEAFDHKIIHTGQHYDNQMSDIFFTEMQLRPPDHTLQIGSLPPAVGIGKMLEGLQPIFDSMKPDMVLVQGDTNTSLAGALAAAKMNIAIGHVEAGCRSFNWSAPEEKNRVMIDHVSDLMFAPDAGSMKNLMKEGLSKKKCFIVGNTGLDAALRTQGLATDSILKKYNLKPKEFVLATIHRAENTDNKKVLAGLIHALNEISEYLPVVFPVHPRTEKLARDYGIEFSPKLKRIELVGNIDFVSLLKNSLFVASDSGGIQEEAAVINVPCLILRTETEWIRLVKARKNFLVGTEPKKIIAFSKKLIKDKNLQKQIAKRKVPLQFGAAKKIVALLKKHIR